MKASGSLPKNVVCKLLFNNSENVMHANIILSFLNQRKQQQLAIIESITMLGVFGESNL